MGAPLAPPQIWLPALTRFALAQPLRQWLARTNALEAGAHGYLPALAQHFRGDSKALPAAALTRQFLAGDAGDDLWLSADPCWVQPEMNGARLLACGQMGLSMDAAQALAKPLKPVFGDAGMLLELSSPDRWHVRLAPGTPLPDFAAPEQALGEDIFQHLPAGPQGKRWRLLLNEVQVLLHQSELNDERRRIGHPPINSLWFWGGGVLPLRLTTVLRGVVSNDMLLQALASRAGIVAQPRGEVLTAALAHAKPGWLVDLQDLPADLIQTQQWTTLEALLRRQSVVLAFASGERWLSRPRHRLRFWRRGAI